MISGGCTYVRHKKFSNVPLNRINKLGDYILKKLKDGYVVLAVAVKNGKILSVDSNWAHKRKMEQLFYNPYSTKQYEYEIHDYSMSPIKDDTAKEPYINICGEEHEEGISEEQILNYNNTEIEEWIKKEDPSEDFQVHWFLSKDIENAWGPLECSLAEFFLEQHPQISITCTSKLS